MDTPVLNLEAPSAAPAGAPPNRSLTVAELLGRVVAARDLAKQCSAPPTWLWHGYLSAGRVTLLTSQWKSGKTTLVSLLLARMQQGGQLAGLPVSAGKALVISEESEADWGPRFQQLGVSDHVYLLCRPFTTQPSMEQWLALIETAAALRERQGTDLVVIDSLAPFLPAHSENSASAVLECMTPLQRLATAGMAVLLPHHPRKGKTVAGQAARGNGALPGFADIIIEMGYYASPDDLDRRRRLVAFSRSDQTPRHLLIELAADGTSYAALQSGVEAAFGENWQAVLGVLSVATLKLTRQEILDHWPEGYDKPDATTLWRWLSRAVAQGVVRQDGTGRPGEPFRYWLPARQDMVRPDGESKEELKAWNERCMSEMFDKLETKANAQAPTLLPAAGDTAPAEPPAAPETTVLAPEPIEPEPAPPPAEPQAAPSASPVPARSRPAEVVAPDPPVRLPFPYNIMTPADVRPDVWERARAAAKTEAEWGQ